VALSPSLWLAAIDASFGDPFILFKGAIERPAPSASLSMLPFTSYFISFPFVPVALLLALFHRFLRTMGLITVAVFVFQYAFVWKSLGPIFSERYMSLPGYVGLMLTGAVMAAYQTRLPRRAKTWLVAPVVLVHVILAVFSLKIFPPTYDDEMKRLGKLFASSPAWAKFDQYVFTDLGTGHFPIVAVLSGKPQRFREIHVDEAKDQVFVPLQLEPGAYLLSSAFAIRTVKERYPMLHEIPIKGVVLLVRDAALADDLRTRSRLILSPF
jgi:hypothetical protein